MSDAVVLRSHIGGRWCEGAGPELLDLDPARPERLVAAGRLLDAAQLREAIDAAADAAAGWRRTPIHQRAAVLVRTAELLERDAARLADELTAEQGKTLAESRAEVARAARVLRYNAGLADAPDGEVYAATKVGERVLTMRVPAGVTAVITPWNVPLAIPAWKLAPALLWGTTVVWKPARLVPLLAQRLMEAFVEAGLPPGVCNLVLAGTDAGDALLVDPRVRVASFTGSTAVGRGLVALGAEHRTRVHAEMGGKNAAIVLADADLDWAAGQIVSGAMLSTGQRCTATSLAYVERSVYDELVTRVVRRTAELRTGDPRSADVDFGPLASDGRRRDVLARYATARRDATVLAGGAEHADESGGYYVQPTVVVDVPAGHALRTEEIFGPLVACVPVEGADEAVALANASAYGLSGAIFTKDLGRVLSVVDELEVGVLHVNAETCGADPHVPFGGMKDSGTALREMGLGARDMFTEIRTVYLRAGQGSLTIEGKG
jgi:acyl-CoA reductase-like NAD-dependent aldehyde dehydrogenase